MNPESLIRALQTEVQRHTFDTFVDIATGGRGIVVSGCPACKKRMQSMNQFTEHLAKDVIPGVVQRAIAEMREPGCEG
jgi:hypothetical protein